MATLTVGIGDCKVSARAGDVLVTHALGSCIAVMIHDPVAKVAGLLHYMLPESSLDTVKAAARPFVFADTGIPLLFHQAYRLGAVKSRLKVFVAGGAQMLESNEAFNIGRRNHLALRRIFAKADVQVAAEDVGGVSSRSVCLDVETGRARVRMAGERR
jgi:chemotaxis protein CheD